jgi:signal transduction histidine kinase
MNPSVNHLTVPSVPGTWQQAHHILDVLSALSYRANTLDDYLHHIACGVSQLLELDWSVVTFCQDGTERVMASSIALESGEHVYSLHGRLTNVVVQTGETLAIEDAQAHPEYGAPPQGYTSYLGIPLRTLQGKIIGTICSFCVQPRQFTLEEIRIVELFAERAATAIDNYTLYQQQRQFNARLELEVAQQTTELHATQALLIERERLAAIGEFAAMIVHEIRNPLTTIVMALNQFKSSSLGERDQQRAALALDEATRLQNLLSEILRYAKPQIPQLSEVDINELVEGMVAALQDMPETLERSIQFVSRVPSAFVSGDRDKLKQVLINLVKNACEAIAPHETVTCQIEAGPEANQICIAVHNGGSPMSAEVLPQPFCSTKAGGTGLGLAIVKRIVDAHQGSLSIESDATSGTTVRVCLPQLHSMSCDR